MNLSIYGLTGLSAILATSALSAQVLHEQAGSFTSATGGLICEITGVIRDSGTAPGNFEFMTQHTGYENVGFCDGGVANAANFDVHGCTVIIQDQDGGTAGTPPSNQFTLTFYNEDLAAPPAAGTSAINPQVVATGPGTGRQTVGPFAMPNTGTVGVPQGFIFGIGFTAAGAAPVSVNRVGSAPGGAGSLFMGVELPVETPPNYMTIGFYTGENLSAFGLTEYDMCNNSSDPVTTVTAAGHGLNGAATCSGGYVYADTVAAILANPGPGFFDPSIVMISPTGPESGFKISIESTRQADTTGALGTGNMPTANVAPGSTTMYSSRRPVNTTLGDCGANLPATADNLYFRFLNANISPSSPVATFISFGTMGSPVSLEIIPGWTGMLCFGASPLTVETGITGDGTIAPLGEFVSSVPLAATAGLAGVSIVWTAAAVDPSDLSIHLGPCERAVY